LEADLIKKHMPPYNIREKDDTSFQYVIITKEKFARVLLIRGKNKKDFKYQSIYGPFVSSTDIKAALRIIRRIFPFNIHPADEVGTFARPCFDAQVGLCPGTCVGAIPRDVYVKTIRNIKLLFGGKVRKMIKILKKEMNEASKKLDFEKAAKLRGQIFGLEHVQDTSFIKEDELLSSERPMPKRIEGYDISNISGEAAVGSMVVFRGDRADKSQYRKFKIKTIEGSDDTGMIAEVLSRRFSGVMPGAMPDLILIDGGRGQVNAAQKVLNEKRIDIPVIGIAKGPERKRNDIIGKLPEWAVEKTLIKVRDEAHRFAVNYHRKLRDAKFFN